MSNSHYFIQNIKNILNVIEPLYNSIKIINKPSVYLTNYCDINFNKLKTHLV